jgi:general secretion pathway protein D
MHRDGQYFRSLVAGVFLLACGTGALYADDAAAPLTTSAQRDAALRQALRNQSNGIPMRLAQRSGTNVAGASMQPPFSRTAARPTPPVRTNSIAVPSSPTPGDQTVVITPSAQATNTSPEEMIPAGTIDFRAVDLNQVLQVYAELRNRTILRPANLASQAIVLKTQTALTKREAIQALDAVLALNAIAMIDVGDKFVKAVQAPTAGQEGQAFSKLLSGELPDMGQYLTHVVQLKFVKPSELVQALQPFAKVPNAIMPIDSSQILVLRDFTENVKRMLEVIAEIDVAIPSEYDSEVIPIKYALASDISAALNSLGGGGGGTTVGSGSRGAGGLTGGGMNRGTGIGGGIGQPGRVGYPGQTTPGSTSPFGTQGTIGQPGAAGQPAGNSFTDRLQSIIKRASATGDIQILGQTKIIADERTNSLLIFASKADMAMIKDIISKLDVVLAQVLIEAIIMEVSLDDSRNLGVSYQEGPNAHGLGNYFHGIGGINNGNMLSPNSFSAVSNAVTGLSPGFSYLASFGQDLDVTLTAIAQDNRVNVLSRPRIQTSHAVPANLFIGNTVPYITGTTFGYVGTGSQSQYTEKQVGITLNVLPLINPDGLVVMDIQQDIEQLGTPTTIDGNSVPTTTKRSASAKVAVKDRDTVILGGFISTTKTVGKSGVPYLKDIPLLGYLFRSTSDSHQRVELIVMMRPTVLPTPEIAAAVAATERHNLPGVRRAEIENRADEATRQKQADREDKEH